MILFLFRQGLSGKELSDEKINDFKRLALTQTAVIFSLFLLDLVKALDFPYRIEIMETIFFGLIGVYVFFLWDMMRNYTNSRAVILTYFIFIMGVFFIGLVGINPFFPMPFTSGYRIFLAVVQFCLLAVESTVIYFTLMEFFKKDLSLSIRLWGAASIYLMIGLAFGGVYEIICIAEVDCLGVDMPLRTMALMERMEYSLSILSGMNTPYDHPIGMIYSIGMIEALWGQLFFVLIVGRLMMK